MQKTATQSRYKHTSYNTRHLRLDLLNRLKEIACKLGDTVEGTLNRALAIGVPLLTATIKEKQNGGRTKRTAAKATTTTKTAPGRDRKSTRLNSSHSQISHAVFCLKK